MQVGQNEITFVTTAKLADLYVKVSIIFLIFFAVTTTAAAADLHRDVPLVWKPTSDLYTVSTANLSPLYRKRIQVLPFSDRRESGKEIGKYIEDGADKPVTTADDVAAWATSRFEYVSKLYGVTLVKDNADVLVSADLLHLYVTEDKTYKGSVGLKVTARSRSGDILWQGIATGTAKRFGRSYKLENYYEVLSDAYLEAVVSLLKNEAFLQSLK